MNGQFFAGDAADENGATILKVNSVAAGWLRIAVLTSSRPSASAPGPR